ncbi:MAG: hypothetical protein JRF52_11085, partial [Deltaproteobacteria bacterium]|nr:hypothetical protein [Deltaproteobacteria bacterium]
MVILSKGFKESYREDIKLFQTIWIKVWMGLFLALFLILPFVADSYIIYLVNLSEIAILGALGL